MKSTKTMTYFSRRVGACLVAALIIAALPFPVFADFRVVELPPAPTSPAAQPAAARADIAGAPAGYVPLDGGSASATAQASGAFGHVAISFVGEAPGVVEARQGMGRDVRLADALRQIAPEGWRGFVKPEFAASFDREKRVNWRGGRRWIDVLDILANENDIAIEVNWTLKHLYIGERHALSAPGATRASAAVTQPLTPAPPPTPTWQAEKGSTLRRSLEAWAEKAACTVPSARAAGQTNWSVAWAARDPMAREVDYRIAVPLVIEGPISEAAKSVIRLYATARIPLGLDVHANQCLLHVFAAERT